MTGRIVHADCLDALREMADSSVDAIVTDPPYGLSKQPDMAEVLRHWLAGDDYEHTGGGFMGKAWDSFVPGPTVWRECLRVLKPGGHALVFAGTRTVDLMGVSLRLAGFEIRDQINWVTGSGFPKSLDVGKAIDKAAGAERVGDRSLVSANGRSVWSSGTMRCESCGRSLGSQPGNCRCQPAAPATPEAARWDGWGTALKPSHEPVIVARRPLDGTVAANVLAWGTGAINVDGCRVPTGPEGLTPGGCTKYGGVFGSGGVVTNPNGHTAGRRPRRFERGER